MGKVFKAVASIGGAVIGGVTGGPAGAIKGFQIGNQVGGLFGGGGGGGGGTAQGNTANGAYFDYFAPSRAQYGTRLNTLMGYGGTPGTVGTPGQATALSFSDWDKLKGNSGRTNYNNYVAGFTPTAGTAGTPGVSGQQAAIDEVMNTPGYMGGMRAGQRELAAGLARTGQVGSGAEQIAYGNLGQDYFRKSYQDLFNQYSALSGATQQPLNMASANTLGADQQRLQDQATGQALGAIGGLFSSSSSNPSVNYTPSGYSNAGGYAPGATSYSPTDTNIGMGGYTGPANMGGGLVGPNWGSV
jgi:hypothetical protein